MSLHGEFFDIARGWAATRSVPISTFRDADGWGLVIYLEDSFGRFSTIVRLLARFDESESERYQAEVWSTLGARLRGGSHRAVSGGDHQLAGQSAHDPAKQIFARDQPESR